MMRKNLAIILVFTLTLLIALPSAYSQASWRGYVKISNSTGNNLTAQAGTVVEGYVNSVLTTRTTVKNGSQGGPTWADGYYLISIPAQDGDEITFKVWNVSINGINTSAQIWAPLLIVPPGGSDNWFNLTISTLAAGAACTWSNACTGDYCCNGGTECNGACSGTCQASACVASSSSSTSPTGGGSTSPGGGGVSAGAEETASVATVSASTASSFSFAKSADLAVSEIVLTTSETVTNNPSITVKTTTFTGTAPVSSGSGAVYKYLLITKLNINDNQISKAAVKFKVEKSWLTSEKIDKDTVKLNRLVDGVWKELSTKKLGEDATNVEYEAETPGFSTFAISGSKKTKPTAAFEIIDEIRAFYAGSSVYSAFEIIDIIKAFYAGG